MSCTICIKCKSKFSGKKKKNINLLSTEFALRMVKVNALHACWLKISVDNI